MLRFGAVGISGVGVNTFFLWFFTEVVGFYYLVSSPIAVWLSILSNFTLNNLWTFADRARDVPLGVRLVKFHVAAAGGFVINFLFLWGLTSAGLYYLLSNLVGILAAFLWNYTVNVKWTFR
jgi:dolichol-phosphate mannosyltransferase